MALTTTAKCLVGYRRQKSRAFRPVRAVACTGMSQARRWQGQAPRDSLLHPVWEPKTAGEPLDEAFVARTLLGAGWVAGKRKLSMLDLRVWAALCGLFRAQYLRAAGESDPDLGHRDTRTVETTGYQIADRVWGDDGGKSYRLLVRSLVRLRLADVTVRVIERDPALDIETLHEGWVSLIGDMWFATTRLDLKTPQQWGRAEGVDDAEGRDRPLAGSAGRRRPVHVAGPRSAQGARAGAGGAGVGRLGGMGPVAGAELRWRRGDGNRARRARTAVSRRCGLLQAGGRSAGAQPRRRAAGSNRSGL